MSPWGMASGSFESNKKDFEVVQMPITDINTKFEVVPAESGAGERQRVPGVSRVGVWREMIRLYDRGQYEGLSFATLEELGRLRNEGQAEQCSQASALSDRFSAYINCLESLNFACVMRASLRQDMRDLWSHPLFPLVVIFPPTLFMVLVAVVIPSLLQQRYYARQESTLRAQIGGLGKDLRSSLNLTGNVLAGTESIGVLEESATRTHLGSTVALSSKNSPPLLGKRQHFGRSDFPSVPVEEGAEKKISRVGSSNKGSFWCERQECPWEAQSSQQHQKRVFFHTNENFDKGDTLSQASDSSAESRSSTPGIGGV